MKAVLRIALACFGMVPLQRWVNLGGLMFFAFAALTFVVGSSASAGGGVFALGIMGAALILLSPGFLGGVVLRHVSTTRRLHLRPHGRLYMLLGASLALTLMAAIGAAPAFAQEMFRLIHDLAPDGGVPTALATFTVAWAALALMWICGFALSRSPFTIFLLGFIPLGILRAGHDIGDWIPGITAAHVFAVGVMAWGLFALWYLTAASIRDTAPLPALAFRPESRPAPFRAWAGSDPAAVAPGSPSTAAYEYLFGSASRRTFVIHGIIVAVLALLMSLLPLPRRSPGAPFVLMMTVFAVYAGAMGYQTARRARLLWLRAGLDRSGLFNLVSRRGLQNTLTTWGIAAGALGLVAIARNTAHTPFILLALASQAAVIACAFFAGLAIVRDLSSGAVLITAALVIVAVLQTLVFRPNDTISAALPWMIMPVLAGALAILLHRHARRRWRNVDWRRISPASLDWRRA